jgi:hypothetical protein
MKSKAIFRQKEGKSNIRSQVPQGLLDTKTYRLTVNCKLTSASTSTMTGDRAPGLCCLNTSIGMLHTKA